MAEVDGQDGVAEGARGQAGPPPDQAAGMLAGEARTLSYDEVRALVIDMRRYFRYHGLPTGECVAWMKLKELTGVGQDHDCPSERPY